MELRANIPVMPGTKKSDALFVEDFIKRYGEFITKAKAAKLIGRSPAYMTRLCQDGSLTEYAGGLSVRELALWQLNGRKRRHPTCKWRV